MNLRDFETYIDPKILKRGLQNFKGGYIQSLDFDGYECTAMVSGSDDYTVTAELSDSGDITFSDCDCPYDFGKYCKHQAAVFYALANELKNPEFLKKKKTVKAPPQNIESILKKQDNATLIAVLLEYASQNAQIKNDLLLRFSEKAEDISENARNLIKASIKPVMRHGFVEYADVRGATKGANRVLQMAGNKSGDILSCAALCVIVLQEMMELLNCCDDSNGYVGGVIAKAIRLIHNTVDRMPNNYCDFEKVFDLVFSHACEKTYSGLSDWHNDLLNACIPMCCMPHLRKRFEDYLFSLQTQEDKSFHSRYVREITQDILYKVADRFDGPDAAFAYIEQNLDNSNFREIAILRALDENRLDYALSLCLDGEKADSKFAGTVLKWQKMRYIIYEKLNDIEAQKKLAAEFVMNSEFEYFTKLKELYAPDEWPPVLNNLLLILEKDRYKHGIYVKILIHEKLKEPLLAYCETCPSTVAELYPHLLPEYENEVGVLFVYCIRHTAEQASSRNQYQDVCEIIKHFRKACGFKKADTIRNELLAKYPKRRAFVDELRKIDLEDKR